jgi:hypothetical protein
MDYNIEPSNSLVKTIISKSLNINYINTNVNILVNEYNTYKNKYKNKYSKIKNEYNTSIDNIKQKQNTINETILKEIYFQNQCNKSLKYIKPFIKDENKIETNSPLIYSISTHNNNKSNNKFQYEFISSLYTLDKSYLSNNNLSMHSLWDIDNINKLILSYKNYFINKLEENTNKNKVFTNKIKKIQLTINELNLKVKNKVDDIVKFRSDKVTFYKNQYDDTNHFNDYTNIYNKLFNNKDIQLDKLDEFYFFDNTIIFNNILEIQTYNKEINKLTDEIKLINQIKINYNSNKFTKLLCEIRNYKNENENTLFIKLKKQMSYNHKKRFPIIIQNKKSFNIFYNKLNKILMNKLQIVIEISKNNNIIHKIEINSLKIEQKEYEDKINNIKVNKKLVMNYLFYKKKLLELEKDILKQSVIANF